MRRTVFSALVLGVLFVGPATAATYQDTFVDGWTEKTFSVDFSGLPSHFNSDVEVDFRLVASGEFSGIYDLTGPTEYFSVSADGIDLGNVYCDGEGQVDASLLAQCSDTRGDPPQFDPLNPVFYMSGVNEVIFSRILNLDSLKSIVGDGEIAFSFAFSENVGAYQTALISISLKEIAPIPLPASAVLLLSGLASLAVGSRFLTGRREHS